MYVLTYHNPHSNNDEVLLGPVEWNPEYISAIIQQDMDLDYRPTILKSDINKIPYEIVPNVIIRRADIQGIEYNPKIQYLIGPNWTYTDQSAIGNYIVASKNVDIVKSELKQEVKNVRYKKEVSGFEFNISDDTKVFITTDREGRRTFFEKLATVGDNTINFKFNDIFVNLDRNLLQHICTSIDNHVQSAFDWESGMCITIDSCNTLEQLDGLAIE